MFAFACYCFNHGHATSYADVSFRSAYLKAHWPAAFLCARLMNYGGFHHPAIYMAEAVRLGIPVRPPHVNHSGRRFTLGREGGSPQLWMGLGQVRDLRRASVRAIVAARRQAPFAGVRDLAARVPLQHKELAHLVQCGALEGLGSSRAALLAEAEEVQHAGSAHQMSFDLFQVPAAAETPAQRLAWERHLLGQPVSVHPLDIVPGAVRETVPLRELPAHGARPIVAAGVRLPGWTGGQGFYLGDRGTFVIAKGGRALKPPRPWQPVLIHGRWLADEWGDAWLQIDDMSDIPIPT